MHCMNLTTFTRTEQGYHSEPGRYRMKHTIITTPRTGCHCYVLKPLNSSIAAFFYLGLVLDAACIIGIRPFCLRNNTRDQSLTPAARSLTRRSTIGLSSSEIQLSCLSHSVAATPLTPCRDPTPSQSCPSHSHPRKVQDRDQNPYGTRIC